MEEFDGIFPWNSQIWFNQFQMDVFTKIQSKTFSKTMGFYFLLENERAGGLTKVLALLLYNSKYFMLKQCLEIKGRDCCRHTFLV